jgi:hypothetical protein
MKAKSSKRGAAAKEVGYRNGNPVFQIHTAYFCDTP